MPVASRGHAGEHVLSGFGGASAALTAEDRIRLQCTAASTAVATQSMLDGGHSGERFPTRPAEAVGYVRRAAAPGAMGHEIEHKPGYLDSRDFRRSRLTCNHVLLQRVATGCFNRPVLEEGGFSFGLLVSGFWFGVRHGIDWDHIAAIADITGSQDERRSALWLGTIYVLGHAAVVFVLGLIAIAFGDLLPEGIDTVMGRIVGATLIVLAVYVFVSLFRHGRDFRLRSRWMLLFSGIRRGSRWVRSRLRNGEAETGGQEQAGDPSLLHHGHHGRPGHHHHGAPEPDDTFANYGTGTALGVGLIHGVGAETPTQVLIFIAAAGAGGTAVGVAVLLAFIVGLVLSNSLITMGSAIGFLSASRNFAVYAAVGVLTAVFSLVLGVLFVLGKESVLPAFFTG
jgi:ABC-type nickel/cobalt efflux system permease component RcnA